MPGRETAARRYAEAAFEVALRDDSVEAWRSALEAAASIATDEQVSHMLANPAVALETRLEMADSVFGKVAPRPVLNLLGLMIRRGRIHELPKVAAEFRRLDNARQGITGGRVELDVQVDPSLLGGLVVRVGDRLIDGSVRGRLERLRNQLVSGAL
jgi:F-type H+-transporting ATPase subunit delta